LHAPITGRGNAWLWRSLGISLMFASGLATLTMIVWTASAIGKASHDGWPRIQVLKMNSRDQSRPLTGRPNKHNELLGGHGSDTIYAGPWGDVLWGDYKPSGQGTSQRDRLYGGAGRDFIYASHGWNLIEAGAGNDWIKAHFGRGVVDCGPGIDTLYISRRAQKHYRIRGCERVSHKTLGY